MCCILCANKVEYIYTRNATRRILTRKVIATANGSRVSKRRRNARVNPAERRLCRINQIPTVVSLNRHFTLVDLSADKLTSVNRHRVGERRPEMRFATGSSLQTRGRTDCCYYYYYYYLIFILGVIRHAVLYSTRAQMTRI